MTLITILLVFLMGYAFATLVIPFCDNLINTITIWFQLIQGRMAVKITENSVKASKLKQSIEEKEDETFTRAIGFEIPEEIEEDEEYDQDF